MHAEFDFFLPAEYESALLIFWGTLGFPSNCALFSLFSPMLALIESS